MHVKGYRGAVDFNCQKMAAFPRFATRLKPLTHLFESSPNVSTL